MPLHRGSITQERKWLSPAKPSGEHLFDLSEIPHHKINCNAQLSGHDEDVVRLKVYLPPRVFSMHNFFLFQLRKSVSPQPGVEPFYQRP